MSTSSKEKNNAVELVVSGKLADNERMKAESNFLRGTIEKDLTDSYRWFYP
jgi:sulfite reductase (NADPH) hemoprotein beta-component